MQIPNHILGNMVLTSALSSKFSTPFWPQTPQFLLQTCRFAHTLGSSSNVPNHVKSLRRKTAPSLGIQKMKHKPLCPWENLSGAQVLPSGNSIRSLHLGAQKLQQLRDTLSSTPAPVGLDSPNPSHIPCWQFLWFQEPPSWDSASLPVSPGRGDVPGCPGWSCSLCQRAVGQAGLK